VCINEHVCFTGCILVLLNAVNVISAVSTCYPVNGQQYCFYTDGSLLSWDEARQFCLERNSTLPIVTDKYISDVLQQFISFHNLVQVSGSNTQQMNHSVWLGAHAQFNNSDPWHWINGQFSGSSHALSNFHHHYHKEFVVRRLQKIRTSVQYKCINYTSKNQRSLTT